MGKKKKKIKGKFVTFLLALVGKEKLLSQLEVNYWFSSGEFYDPIGSHNRGRENMRENKKRTKSQITKRQNGTNTQTNLAETECGISKERQRNYRQKKGL